MKNTNGANTWSVHMMNYREPCKFCCLITFTLFRTCCLFYPHQAAIIHGERQITWQQTINVVASLHISSQLGIKNDTVSVLLPNVPAMIEAHFAVPMAGAVLNTLNTRLDAKTIAFMLAHAESKVLLSIQNLDHLLKKH